MACTELSSIWNALFSSAHDMTLTIVWPGCELPLAGRRQLRVEFHWAVGDQLIHYQHNMSSCAWPYKSGHGRSRRPSDVILCILGVTRGLMLSHSLRLSWPSAVAHSFCRLSIQPTSVGSTRWLARCICDVATRNGACAGMSGPTWSSRTSPPQLSLHPWTLS